MRTRQQKTSDLDGLRERIARAQALVLADYRGLTVQQANELRSRLRAAGGSAIEYRVTKNTLLRRAVAGTPYEALAPRLVGPTSLALAYEAGTALARTLVDYAKANEKFEIKGGLIEGELVDLAGIRAIAALPSKDELRAKLARTLRTPMQNLAGVLVGLLQGVRTALERRAEQLEKQLGTG